jgi:hypothetical protein
MDLEPPFDAFDLLNCMSLSSFNKGSLDVDGSMCIEVHSVNFYHPDGRYDYPLMRILPYIGWRNDLLKAFLERASSNDPMLYGPLDDFIIETHLLRAKPGLVDKYIYTGFK